MNNKLELKERIKWLIILRFIACIGVFVVITTVKYFLRDLPVLYLYLGNIILFLYNIIFLFYYLRISNKDTELKTLNNFANLQISTDLVMLTYLIYFSGGVENPFIFYFIFHIIIASILLSNKSAYLQATLAILLLGGVTLLEYLRILPHYHLLGFISSEYCLLPLYLVGVFFVFVTASYITVYFTTNIVNKLRAIESELLFTNKRLDEENRLKSRYVWMVSHDIQSSLSTIESCLKVVLDGYGGEVPEKAKEMIMRAEGRTLFLLHFVKDILDLSKIKIEREIQKKEFSLKGLIENILVDLKPKIEEKNISLQLQLKNQTSFYADPSAIEQLFANLISNGIKYTPFGGKISVHLKEVKDKLGCFHIMVQDTGIGIEGENLDKIFDEFYRTKNAQKFLKDETGLGLSIVKEIIKIHNGNIWVESEIGKGSKFFITLSNNLNCAECERNKIF